MQLQDAVWVLELDRVLDGDRSEVEDHRAGLAAARENRIELVRRTTSRLLAQMAETIDRANSTVLLNPFDSPAAVRASNIVADAVVHRLDRVGLEASHKASDARKWRRAVVETGDRAVSTGVAGVRAAGRAGAQGIGQVTQPFRAVDIDGDGIVDRPRATVAAEQAGDALKGAASGVSGAFKTLFGRPGQRDDRWADEAKGDALPL